nr:MAG TPA_asm: hypothetical protein [Caudoviricetes sp.]
MSCESHHFTNLSKVFSLNLLILIKLLLFIICSYLLTTSLLYRTFNRTSMFF